MQGMVVAYPERARRQEGVIFMPTIEGRMVKPPDERFTLANWSDVCSICAEAGFYVVQDKGKRGGVRLGTMVETGVLARLFESGRT